MANNRKTRKKIEENEVVTEAVTVESVNEEVVTESTVVYGVVTNCAMLNVRSEPRLKSSALGKIKMGVRVEIDKAASTNDFYKIHTKDFDGYCMKKFITIEC